MHTSRLLLANHSSSVGEARRMALRFAEELEFSEEDRGRIAVVINEGVSNLVKHAREGELILGPGVDGQSLEMLFCDKGPGMNDVARCLSDGYSTAGTMGGGMGAMNRLSDSYSVYSIAGQGTLISCTLAKRSGPEERTAFPLDVAAHALPYPGENECGDAISVQASTGRVAFCVVDGLGHGPEAAKAAQASIRVFEESSHLYPGEILQRCHQALGHTRGAAIAITILDRGQLIHCGIGNISCYTVGPAVSQQHLLSHDGIVGYTARRFQEKTYVWDKNAQLVMHSDGILTRSSLVHFAGSARRNVRLSAAFLLRDCRRGRDDTSVVVASERKIEVRERANSPE